MPRQPRNQKQRPIMSGSATWWQPKSLESRANRRVQRVATEMERPVAPKGELRPPVLKQRRKPLVPMPEALLRFCVGVGR